jgi:hypothetical protein
MRGRGLDSFVLAGDGHIADTYGAALAANGFMTVTPS